MIPAHLRRHLALYLMLVPGLGCLLLFSYVPMYGLVIAFKDFRMDLGILHSPWVGWENFARLFAGPDFRLALRNTVGISLLHLVFGFSAPIVLALLLNEVRLAGFKRGVQTLTYLPHFFSWVILGGIALTVFAVDGPVNLALRLAGSPPVPFFSSDAWFIVLLVGTGIWQSAGWGSVVYLAALSGVPPQLYEAATVDGANRWQQVRHVTLPALVPTIVTLFILSLGGFLNAGFDQIYNLYNPSVYDVADIIDTYVLRRMQGMDFSLATAAGLFKSAVGCLLLVTVNFVARRLSGGEQGVF